MKYHSEQHAVESWIFIKLGGEEAQRRGSGSEGEGFLEAEGLEPQKMNGIRWHIISPSMTSAMGPEDAVVGNLLTGPPGAVETH